MAEKICDILNLSSHGRGCASCYENQLINRLKSVRYENYIPTGKGISGSMDLPFFHYQYPTLQDFDLTLDLMIR